MNRWKIEFNIYKININWQWKTKRKKYKKYNKNKKLKKELIWRDKENKSYNRKRIKKFKNYKTKGFSKETSIYLTKIKIETK